MYADDMGIFDHMEGTSNNNTDGCTLGASTIYNPLAAVTRKLYHNRTKPKEMGPPLRILLLYCERGIPQGQTIPPLMWIILHGTHLTTINSTSGKPDITYPTPRSRQYPYRQDWPQHARRRRGLVRRRQGRHTMSHQPNILVIYLTALHEDQHDQMRGT